MADLAMTTHSITYPSPTSRSTVVGAPRRRRMGRLLVAGWLLIVAGWLGVAMTMPGGPDNSASTTTVAQPAPAPAPAPPPAPLVRFVPD
jgi:hypothetical protein